MKVKAKWKDVVLALSGNIHVVDGFVYFPPETVDRRLLEPSAHRTVCPKKGIAHYFHVRIGDDVNEDAAWTYPDPKPAAEMLRDQIAFWKGIAIG